MDQTRADVGNSAQLGSPGGATSPASSGWDAYYQQASLRRRTSGSARKFRKEKRRRRLRERVGLGISAAFVAAMTVAFYLMLR